MEGKCQDWRQKGRAGDMDGGKETGECTVAWCTEKKKKKSQTGGINNRLEEKMIITKKICQRKKKH